MNKYILGDCISEMEKMDANSIDIIITSPPYNLKNRGGILKLIVIKII